MVSPGEAVRPGSDAIITIKARAPKEDLAGVPFPFPQGTHTADELALARRAPARAEKPSQTISAACRPGQVRKERDSPTATPIYLIIMIDSGILENAIALRTSLALHNRFSEEGTPVVRLSSPSLRARVYLAVL